MKRVFLSLVMSLFLVGNVNAAEPSLTLPAPAKTGGMSLQEALSKRNSHKSFSGQELDMQTISDVLWSAYGINREDLGKRTIPTANNKQNLTLYVVLPSGAYSYDAKSNKLELIAEGDHRANAGMQSEMLSKAGMIIVYVEQLGDAYNKFNSGAASQNVGLYAASNNLANVVVGSANVKELGELLKLSRGMQVQVIQAVGYKG